MICVRKIFITLLGVRFALPVIRFHAGRYSLTDYMAQAKSKVRRDTKLLKEELRRNFTLFEGVADDRWLF